MNSPQPPKIPVTLLCGFLGSGKTTLIRQILTRSPSPVAVIENEYSPDGSVERVLATFDTKYQNSDLFVELPNGCVCCSVKDSLVETLERLLQRKNDFSHIVLELSGLADPGPLASIFWLDDELHSPLILDGIVCVVDAQNVAHTSETQVAYADRVLLNKVDLVSADEVKTIVSGLRHRYPDVFIMETCLVRDEISLDAILKIQSVGTHNMVQSLLHSHHDATGKSSSRMTSVVLTRSKPLATDKFRTWIGTMLWSPTDEFALYRIKGVICSAQDGSAFVVQAVHETLDFRMLASDFTSVGLECSMLVLIGKGLNEIELKRQFVDL